MRVLVLSGAALLTAPAAPVAAKDVSSAQLRATIEHLVGFGTRHTLSDQASPTRGIGAARTYVAARFAAIAAQCGGCLAIEMPEQMVEGERIPGRCGWSTCSPSSAAPPIRAG